MPSHWLSLLLVFAYQIANRSGPIRTWLLVVDCSRSASIPEALQQPFGVLCVLFVFIFTKISFILPILYPKTYKMHVILHFFLKIFCSFK